MNEYEVERTSYLLEGVGVFIRWLAEESTHESCEDRTYMGR